MDPLTDSKLKAVVEGDGMTYAKFIKAMGRINDAEPATESPKYYLCESQYNDWIAKMGKVWVEAHCVKESRMPT